MKTAWICGACFDVEAALPVGHRAYDKVISPLGNLPGRCDRCDKGGELVAVMRVKA